MSQITSNLVAAGSDLRTITNHLSSAVSTVFHAILNTISPPTDSWILTVHDGQLSLKYKKTFTCKSFWDFQKIVPYGFVDVKAVGPEHFDVIGTNWRATLVKPRRS